MAPTTMYHVTGMPTIWHMAKKATSVTAMATRNARTLVGSFFQVRPFRTSTMMFVTITRASTTGRMMEMTTGMFWMMLSIASTS